MCHSISCWSTWRDSLHIHLHELCDVVTAGTTVFFQDNDSVSGCSVCRLVPQHDSGLAGDPEAHHLVASEHAISARSGVLLSNPAVVGRSSVVKPNKPSKHLGHVGFKFGRVGLWRGTLNAEQHVFTRAD